MGVDLLPLYDSGPRSRPLSVILLGRGWTNPTYRDHITEFEDDWRPFRRALCRDELDKDRVLGSLY